MGEPMGEQLHDSAVIKAAAEFAQAKIAPIAAELDEEGRAPTELFEEMAQLGFFGMRYPKELGGKGLSATESYFAVSELAKASAGVALLVEVHWMAIDALLKFGSEEQKARWIPDLLSGKRIAAYTISEACAGSDAAGITTVAEKVEGGYRLNGAKYFSTNGGVADLYVIAAKTDPEAGGKGISVFVVDIDTPGFRTSPNIQKLGCRSSEMTALSFKDCFVPAENLVGAENGGFKAAMYGLVGGRVGMVAMGLGIASAALDSAAAYANRRMAFGAALAKMPAVQSMVAEMHVKVETIRHMLLAVTEKMDRGEDVSLDSSTAKIAAAEAVNEVCHKALQIHGGHGYIKGNATERYYRDGRLMDIGVGASEVLKSVVGGSVLRSYK